MRAYWILPNRGQGDDILASNGGKIVPLRQILEPALRPPGFSHGVPTELLEKCGSKRFSQILFAQRFPDWTDHQQLFLVATPAGVDSSGRVVHLSLLFILDPHERPRFDLSDAGLPHEDRLHAHALTRRMAAPQRSDLWARSVLELSQLPSRRGPATNVELDRSAVRFDFLYTVASDGSIRKAVPWRKYPKRSMLVLLVLAVVGIGLGERACQHSTQPSVWTGATLCHFS